MYCNSITMLYLVQICILIPRYFFVIKLNFNNLFFFARRYDISRVGRYKYNKKLALERRIAGLTLAEPVADPLTGEVMFDAGVTVTRADAALMDKKGVREVIVDIDGHHIKVISNNMVNAEDYVDLSKEELEKLVSRE